MNRKRFQNIRLSGLVLLSFLLVITMMGAPLVAASDTSRATAAAGDILSIEAEASANTFTGYAGPVDCDFCSGGQKVGNLYGGSTMTFQQVTVDRAGVYDMSIVYISGDARAASISVNDGEKENFAFPKTVDWNTAGSYTIQIYLNEGSNTILFDDDGGYSPDLDKIELVYHSAGVDDGYGDGNIGDLGKQKSVTHYGPIVLTEYAQGFSIANPSYELVYNTSTGLSRYSWNGRTVATGLYSEIMLEQMVASKDYKHHKFHKKNVVPFEDSTGQGVKVTVQNEHPDFPDLSQVYYVYNDAPYLLTEIIASDKKGVATADIAPIAMEASGGIDIGSYDDNRVLVVPFDNDAWSRYQAKSMNTGLNNHLYISSELTAIYDNTSRTGLVIGSVTHDTWKTGIYWSGSDDKLNKLRVYGGFTSSTSTHDTISHGAVTGSEIRSPKIMVGFFEDYRDGLKTFGEVNAAIQPPLAFGENVPDGVPVGWNSWGAYDSGLSYDKAVDVSNYFKEFIQDHSFNNEGNIYINLDSYWDNMTDQQLADLVQIIHRNEQKAGIYYSPFVYWGNNMEQEVEGTNGRYKYGDIVLRDQEGQVLPTLDGAYAVDPTHPATKQRIDHYMNRFKDLGFEFIKIDFLSHGALEGQHYDPNVQTGIQAYNQGMAYLNEVLDGSMFISASIAPLFPSQYAHSRRISCDIDGSIGSTEYQLNNLTYGWWQNGTIYHYTDPDYMTLAKGGSFEGSQSRVNAAAISGTVYLNADDVSNETARAYMSELLTNPVVNELALKGKAFRPVEGNTGNQAADLFVLAEGEVYYAAVFNYTSSPVQQEVDFERAGIPAGDGVSLRVTDLWSGESIETEDVKLTVELQAAESKLYRIERSSK
ncbi:carbohydrate-binding protein [Paenibacillus campinasensis]|uniref:Carbohydrate-binding protein n=2 Tax=Paenibacillus campinasensis TaxID=66347 RepID=A0ABW9SZB9_9BACL|nr:carbohydrate-binding protein [Paenibacillus campinasensis]